MKGLIAQQEQVSPFPILALKTEVWTTVVLSLDRYQTLWTDRITRLKPDPLKYSWKLSSNSNRAWAMSCSEK